jgi:glycogen debranching enzyme
MITPGVHDKYYIASTFAHPDPLKLILKHGDMYGVFDRFGDIKQSERNEQGLYLGGTRFLSRCMLHVNNARPLFLSSTVDEENLLMTIDLTNPDFYEDETCVFRRDSVHILRSRLLCNNAWHETIRVRNFGNLHIHFFLSLSFDADFRDLFEIRGMKRKERGTSFPPEYREREIVFSYYGLDEQKRSTHIFFDEAPEKFEEHEAVFRCDLRPGTERKIFFSAQCLLDNASCDTFRFDECVSLLRNKREAVSEGLLHIHTSNDQFNESFRRASADISMMTTETEYGCYPYGGIPWFCTPFGRDGIITALQCLWYNPELAGGVLRYLAVRQSGTSDRRRAAQPGKILHEVRAGEMASMNEIPFGLYFGSVDSTPLFVILAGRYWKRTGDSALIQSLWKNIKASLAWLDEYGDADRDGFIEYLPDEKGLRNQGWKDSQDSVFDEQGRLATGAIALCEVQGYAYAARMEGAMLAGMMGEDSLERALREKAGQLKKRFNEVFWDDRIDCFVLALDGDKKPCRVVSSNTGHTLFAGIAERKKAEKIAATLLSELSFSGWGIRTIAAKEPRYNPMSYHNGSIWPHDNSIVAAGLAAYGFRNAFSMVFSAIFEASLHMEFHRLPELFCGFHRRKGVAPTLYPVACSPQTWASGSLPFMLQASLGLHFEAPENRIVFREPCLPEFLDYVRLSNLRLGSDKKADLLIRRHDEDVSIEVLRKDKDLEIVIVK